MPGPSLSLEVKQEGNATVVFLSGDIDASSLNDFQSAVEPLCNVEGAQVVLECAALNYVNSAGLGLLFALSRACKTIGGQLLMCGVRSKVKNVIHVLGLDNLLELRDERSRPESD